MTHRDHPVKVAVAHDYPILRLGLRTLLEGSGRFRLVAEGTTASAAQLAAKTSPVAATLAWSAALGAGKSAADAARAASAYTAKYGGRGPATPTAAASRSLGVVQVGQNTSYYCGPASGYMMIRYLHGAGFNSRYDGSAPGQAGLANGNHMATDANKVTSWSSGRYVTGVNRWRGSSYYVQVHAPASLTGVFSFSIGDNGMPFAGDTVEIANGSHYNGHPRDKTIGHWPTAYGYTSYGAVGNWADSSTTVWSAPSPTFSYNSDSFNGFLQSNGVAY